MLLKEKSYNFSSKQNIVGYITEFMYRKMKPESKRLEF